MKTLNRLQFGNLDHIALARKKDSEECTGVVTKSFRKDDKFTCCVAEVISAGKWENKRFYHHGDDGEWEESPEHVLVIRSFDWDKEGDGFNMIIPNEDVIDNQLAL